mmetsp:Transcript_55976/g.149270  ORF Transcript_55976/g.149270 Transcript_55976/m.149270 type:complete len:234 (-) Transcript_55976:387-1088(-)
MPHGWPAAWRASPMHWRLPATRASNPRLSGHNHWEEPSAPTQWHVWHAMYPRMRTTLPWAWRLEEARQVRGPQLRPNQPVSCPVRPSVPQPPRWLWPPEVGQQPACSRPWQRRGALSTPHPQEAAHHRGATLQAVEGCPPRNPKRDRPPLPLSSDAATPKFRWWHPDQHLRSTLPELHPRTHFCMPSATDRPPHVHPNRANWQPLDLRRCTARIRAHDSFRWPNASQWPPRRF